MLKISLKTAWRSIRRNRMFSALNVVGLAIGMAVALLIGLWGNYQYSYDRFLPDYEQAYQVKYNYGDKGEINTRDMLPIPLADAIRNVPGIDKVALSFGTETYGPLSQTLIVGDKKLGPVGIATTPDFLKIFKYPLLKGTVEEALSSPQAIVLTESIAKALFGNDDPMGKTVDYGGNVPLKVTGVLKDLPGNSTFKFDFLTSFAWYELNWGWVKNGMTDWNLTEFKLYVSLKPHVTYSQVQSKIDALVKTYAPATYEKFRQHPILAPLKDWHLYPEYSNGVATGSLLEYVHLFTFIGILVLLIACINFMNLSTARSEKRAVEVGIRKVIGSTRGNLVMQFLTESIVLAFAAFLLALGIVRLVLPAFNALAGMDIQLPFTSPVFWLLMLSYILLTGCLAGSRPAFYLSSFQPVKVLKGDLTRSRTRPERGTYPSGAKDRNEEKQGTQLRRSSMTKFTRLGKYAALPRQLLVVLQFSSSIAFIIGTIVIYQQIQYARNRPRGYDANRLVVTDGWATNNYRALKHDALQTGLITSMTASFSPPTDIYGYGDVEQWTGGRESSVPLKVALNAIGDTDYFKTLGMRFVAGGNFTGNIDRSDTLCAIFNEAAIRRMGIKDPVNQTISWSYSTLPPKLRIIGVVNDAVTNAPFAAAEPTIFVYRGWLFSISYRLMPGVDAHAALDKLRTIFEKYRPDIPYDYHFVDDSYAGKFAMETLVGKLAGIFAALAIFISCLGLFGLAAYVAEQRTREIGIRKVLGASVKGLFLLVIKDFLLLVLISCVVASPIALYFLRNWLDGYYYHISISPAVFAVTAVGAIVIAVATVSFQAMRAALMNPVDSLRAE